MLATMISLDLLPVLLLMQHGMCLDYYTFSVSQLKISPLYTGSFKPRKKHASPKYTKVPEVRLWKLLLQRLLRQSDLPGRAERGNNYQNMTEYTVQCFSQLSPISNQGHNLNNFLISLQMLKLQMLTDH